jgi:light-regulated signal transduction histidine kinase (bacteriophytochrome)
VALLAYTVSLVFCAATGLGPDVLLFLYVPPPLCLAGRGGLPGAALVATTSGTVYAYGGYLADRTDLVATGIAMGFASGGLAVAISFARARVIEQADERTALTRELQRANAELDSFASVASHDLAAPLRTISGFAGLLDKRYRGQLDAEGDEMLNFITAGTERMQQTIDDLLAFARAGRIFCAETPFSLEGPLAGARMNLQATIDERGASIHHGPLPMVWGDERRIAQVFQNLIANGIKFCPLERTPVIDVSAHRIPAGWRVEVRDNGIGIDPRHAARAFGMFQRLHSEDEYPGTGVGLAICQRIVERHGGRIWMDPQPGGGTLVAFTLSDPA